MADQYSMDPARIERLRSPERLEYFDPERIWDTLSTAPRSTLVDIGVGVGFVSLPFALRYPESKVIGARHADMKDIDPLAKQYANYTVEALDQLTDAGHDIITDIRHQKCVDMPRSWIAENAPK